MEDMINIYFPFENIIGKEKGFSDEEVFADHFNYFGHFRYNCFSGYFSSL
jgi:hypothetical protein